MKGDEKMRFFVNILYLRLTKIIASSWETLSNKKELLKRWLESEAKYPANNILDSWLIESLPVPATLTRCVHPVIVNAIRLFVTKDRATEYYRNAGYLVHPNKEANRFTAQALENSAYNKGIFSDLECISKKGLLKVLLTVYIKFLCQSVKRGQESISQGESLKIFEFIALLADLEKWNPEDVKFQGNLVSFIIVPVAVRSANAFDIYTKRIETYSRKKEIDAIFVVAIGRSNECVARKAAESFYYKHSKEFEMHFKAHYDVLTRDGKQNQGTTVLLSRRDSALENVVESQI